MTFTTEVIQEVVNGTEDQIEDLIISLVEANRTDLIAKIESMGIVFAVNNDTGNLVLCSCSRKRPSPEDSE